jgi:hypothetical protein
MTCEFVQLPGGGTAIICTAGRRKRCACGRLATLACDWKAPRKKSGTCDAPICDRCTTSPAPDKDLCAKHATALEEWKARRDLPPRPVQVPLL